MLLKDFVKLMKGYENIIIRDTRMVIVYSGTVVGISDILYDNEIDYITCDEASCKIDIHIKA